MVRGNSITEIEAFSFKLASHLHMTVGFIDNNMSAREFFKWAEYLELNKSMAERNEIMLAQLTSLLFNINSKEKRSTMDFLISISDEDKKAHKENEASKNLLAYLRSINGSR